MQELSDSIKRPNMGIEEGKEVQVKGIHSIFNKIITENYQSLRKFDHSDTGSLQNAKQMTKK
jgi:hypothetical protein